MLFYVNAVGEPVGAGIKIDDLAFQLFGAKGTAMRLMTGFVRGVVATEERGVYINTGGAVVVETNGEIQYNDDGSVACVGGKKVVRDSAGRLVRVGSADVTAVRDPHALRTLIDARLNTKFDWQFDRNGDITSVNGIVYGYGEYFDFGEDTPWSHRRVLSSLGGIPIRYDSRGRVTQVDGRPVEYDARGRISRA